MNFEDTKIAYALKSDQELFRAYLIFKMISKQILVRLGGALALIVLRLGLPLKAIFRKTVYQQFCAGQAEDDSLKVVESLARLNVKSYMHFAAEGQKNEKGMDESMKRVLETLLLSKQNNALPFAVFKATALGSVHLFEKQSAGMPLDAEELLAWDRVMDRITECCEFARQENVRLLVDAEESWLQAAIDEIVLSLMRKYNTGKQPFIFNTVQMYRKDRLNYLKTLFQTAENEGFQLGIKLVRGAYIEKENDRALEKAYPSPICDSKQETDINFDRGLDLILSKLDQCELFLGSHNEKSTMRVVQWMNENKLSSDHAKIWFSQLYGMADHISFNLAAAGYQVIKYVPFGPLKEVLPYLIRRAEENTSVQGQTPRELNLIKKELKRRKKTKVS
jgi:proline dehydrogenase